MKIISIKEIEPRPQIEAGDNSVLFFNPNKSDEENLATLNKISSKKDFYKLHFEIKTDNGWDIKLAISYVLLYYWQLNLDKNFDELLKNLNIVLADLPRKIDNGEICQNIELDQNKEIITTNMGKKTYYDVLL